MVSDNSFMQSEDYLLEQHEEATKALRVLASVCRDHKIPFFLLAGSVLGAVRHKGFIPWDDDIDIGIMDEDYERFKREVSRELPAYGFEFRDRFTNPSIPRRFGKVVSNRGYGVVDCFRLIRVPDNTLLQYLHWNAKRILNGIWKRKVFPPVKRYNSLAEMIKWNGRGLIVMPLTKLMPIGLVEKQLTWIERHPGVSSVYVSNFYSIYSMKKELIPIQWLREPSMLTFEGDLYPAPGDFDAYLKKLYGDYMTPPKLENRRPTHSFNRFK